MQAKLNRLLIYVRRVFKEDKNDNENLKDEEKGSSLSHPVFPRF